MELSDVKHVIFLKTDFGGCKLCDTKNLHNLESTINHYLSCHDYKLLYAGSETEVTDMSEIQTATVAMLGK